MRKLIILSGIILTLCAPTFAQTLVTDSVSQKYTASSVVELKPELTKEQLFQRAKEWIALNYKSANDVIQLADKESGKIICKGRFVTNMFMKQGALDHTLILDFKDGRMRYTFSDFAYSSPGSGTLAFESNKLGFKKKVFAETDEKIKVTVASLKAYLLSTSSKTDNW